MKTKQLLFLSANDIKNVISMKQAIELMKGAFSQISQGKVTIPLRTHLEIAKHDGGTLFMPAYSEERNLVSLKLVTVFRNNPKINLPLIHALLFLIDGSTGKPLAIMDGEYLTALRTGAGSGLATDLLARQDANTLGIFGAGVQGRTQMSAICEVRDIRRIYIFDKNAEASQKLASSVQSKMDMEVNPAVDKISECDVICTATTSPTPVFEDVYINAGTHINAVGTYQADRREIPGGTVRRSKLVVDQRSACLKEAGDLIIPLAAKLIDKDHIYAELGELIDGDKIGRSDNSEITIFKSVGNAAQDLFTAEHIFKFAKETGIGTSIAL
jgi:ornithine cyclodeaminase/alanine dehydrogenase-like protein (mu-crystallin family)